MRQACSFFDPLLLLYDELRPPRDLRQSRCQLSCVSQLDHALRVVAETKEFLSLLSTP